jgi:hypothetical protein
MGEVLLQLRRCWKLRRAQQARHRQSAAGVGPARTDLVRCVAQVAGQIPGQERIACTEHVVDLDLPAYCKERILERSGDGAGEHHTATRAAFADDDGVG